MQQLAKLRNFNQHNRWRTAAKASIRNRGWQSGTGICLKLWQVPKYKQVCCFLL